MKGLPTVWRERGTTLRSVQTEGWTNQAAGCWSHDKLRDRAASLPDDYHPPERSISVTRREREQSNETPIIIKLEHRCCKTQQNPKKICAIATVVDY